MSGFFTLWPGDANHSLGLGRALFEFQEWEIQSERIADVGGSPWWSEVNGRLVSDLHEAAGGAAGPWRCYIEAVESGLGDLQALLWAAHQHSIGEGVAGAAGLLEAECDTEAAFAGLALSVVEHAAVALQRTSSSALGRATRELYPSRYPCLQEDLDRLDTALAGGGRTANGGG
ncbi:MAG: hypothetical protein IT195_01370 [Microthrixaceae bacterium]|nr:hypothetical protein [Microthrixaceae bacterium]